MARKGYMFGGDNMVTDGPCFFKIFLDGFNITEHLHIPPEFKKHVLQDLCHSSRALLKGPSGGVTPVKVFKTENEIFLKDGWKNFVRNNSLGNKEFLLFTYDGNRFTVQIFDVDGMERVSMPDLWKDQHPIITPDNDKGKGKKKPTETDPRSKRNTYLSAETSSYAQHRSSKQITNLNQMILESFNSKLPNFQVRLKSYQIEKSCSLHIPNTFSRSYLPAEKTKLVLRNEKGKTWDVYSIPYGHGGINYGFYGGWGLFLRGNNLKENDVCIFELVDPREMMVHIVRSCSHR